MCVQKNNAHTLDETSYTPNTSYKTGVGRVSKNLHTRLIPISRKKIQIKTRILPWYGIEFKILPRCISVSNSYWCWYDQDINADIKLVFAKMIPDWSSIGYQYTYQCLLPATEWYMGTTLVITSVLWSTKSIHSVFKIHGNNLTLLCPRMLKSPEH